MNALKNRDLKKWLLATSDYGQEIQDLNAIVGHDEKFNNAIVRHALDLKNEAFFRNPNPLNVTFHNVKKFYLVIPVISKLATQVKASKLTDYDLMKNILGQGETDKLQNRFELFKKGLDEIIDDEDDDENIGRGGSGIGGGEEGEVETTELRQDHHQIYMVETFQQKIQDLLLKLLKKDFKIEVKGKGNFKYTNGNSEN